MKKNLVKEVLLFLSQPHFKESSRVMTTPASSSSLLIPVPAANARFTCTLSGVTYRFTCHPYPSGLGFMDVEREDDLLAAGWAMQNGATLNTPEGTFSWQNEALMFAERS